MTQSPITVTVTINDIRDPLSRALLALLEDGTAPVKTADAAPAEKPAPAPKKTAAKPAAKKAAAKPAPEPEPEDDEDEDEDIMGGDDAPTMDDAVARATELVGKGKSAQVKAALAEVGAKRVSDLSDDQVPAFLAAL